MLDRLIGWSLANRLLVIAGALGVLLLGAWQATQAPIDVFPDLTAPTVTVMTEAPGLAAEEVEQQINYPIESAVSGASGVRRVRSQAVAGFSIVWVEFDWGEEVYETRQVVTERLSQVTPQLPEGIESPQLGPISSILGEIAFLGLYDEADDDGMQIREVADWVVARQLEAIPGVAQVTMLGGRVRQYQVQVAPERLAALGLNLNDVRDALEQVSRNAGGDRLGEGGQDYLIRFLGRAERLEEIEQAVVAVRDDMPILLRHVADVAMAPGIPVGDAGVNGHPGVVVAVSRQPDADTLDLTRTIDATLERLEAGLPDGIRIEPNLFRQADFIQVAVSNVVEALRDGAIFVALILLVFLLSVRITLVSVIAIPLSLTAAVLALQALGITINTMTLGGMTIAIGALVDDAIIFVENIYRRLREAGDGDAASLDETVRRACSEVRYPVVYSTVIIMLVFTPLFFLGGVEGRLLEPLGVAYLVAIAASLMVALTVTPVLARWLLPAIASRSGGREPPVAALLQRVYRPVLRTTLRFRRSVVAVSALLAIATLASALMLGRSFLPDFNEGSLTVEMATPPGTSLEASAEMARQVEDWLLEQEEILSVARRTGRAEGAEHTQPPNISELEVRLGPLPQGKEAFLGELRDGLGAFPGQFNIGQPISHRIDHTLTGVRADLSVKIVGPALGELQSLANRVESAMAGVDGIVDLSTEPVAAVPQVRLHADRSAMARYGLTVADTADTIDTAWRGARVAQVFEGERRFDVVVRMAEEHRTLDGLTDIPLHTPTGHTIRLNEVAEPRIERGPAQINREGAERRLVVSANIAGRDLRGAATDVRATIGQEVDLPDGYRVELGGQFEAEAQATRTLAIASVGVLIAMLLVLQLALRSLPLVLLVMVNIPLALIGGVIAVFAMGGVLTIAALVGFITLFGIAVRNGLLLISRYQSLAAEGVPLNEAVERGAQERLTPILMTALTAALAMIPLALGLGETGTEIQAPIAIVILGGLLGSTALNMLVLPALYHWVQDGRHGAAISASTR
ncbi:efflux RND transporter permease subunit [Aquisalimonas asiatica]|uniref:Heavy metal efflux pump, CzcA family n=1 Tax=Aquisalimonas asiatica TaxID=406100 RepID=A0A1H8T304_9GAMM|nr:efflux RND transporter permease subunit [Aquisalimonas asiatica]SEO84898.1 heavy metal efflux pump, CzcA family [Aquisalimonas asiatica]